MKKKRGFTVVEMLVALAIMGILVVLSFQVGRSSLQRASITAAINGFVADFNYARQLASRENRYVAFDFDVEGTEGASYTIRILKGISLDPSLETSYTDEKTNSPMNGEPCFSGATDFAVNSMGVVRKYPVDITSNPVSVTINFFKIKGGAGSGTTIKEYERFITIFPTGGIKIEEKKPKY